MEIKIGNFYRYLGEGDFHGRIGVAERDYASRRNILQFIGTSDWVLYIESEDDLDHVGRDEVYWLRREYGHSFLWKPLVYKFIGEFVATAELGHCQLISAFSPDHEKVFVRVFDRGEPVSYREVSVSKLRILPEEISKELPIVWKIKIEWDAWLGEEQRKFVHQFGFHRPPCVIGPRVVCVTDTGDKVVIVRIYRDSERKQWVFVRNILSLEGEHGEVGRRDVRIPAGALRDISPSIQKNAEEKLGWFIENIPA